MNEEKPDQNKNTPPAPEPVETTKEKTTTTKETAKPVAAPAPQQKADTKDS